MRILMGYGFVPGTTGYFFERAFSRVGEVHYIGTPGIARPGFAKDVDIAEYVSHMDSPPDLFLYIDSGNAAYAPTGLEKVNCLTAAFLMDAYPTGISQKNPYVVTMAPLFDYLFVAHKSAIERFRIQRGGCPVHWLPPCCDPEFHGDNHLPRVFDVGFVGQLTSAYPERKAILSALEKCYRMNDFRRRYSAREMSEVYSQSKIVVNVSHTDQIIPMRFFEAPASGALLITRSSVNNGQNELMREGEHFVTFSDLADLKSTIDYYLSHEVERQRIAHAGQAYCLSYHTYDARAAEIWRTITYEGYQRIAPVRDWPAHAVRRIYMRTHAQLRLTDAVMNQVNAPVWERLWFSMLAILRRLRHRYQIP